MNRTLRIGTILLVSIMILTTFALPGALANNKNTTKITNGTKVNTSSVSIGESGGESSGKHGSLFGITSSILIDKTGTLGPYDKGHRYYIHVYNVDDVAKAIVNGNKVAQVNYPQGDKWVEITNYLKDGSNTIELTDENGYSGWTYGFEISQDNSNIILTDSCGIVGHMGCMNNDVTNGFVYRNIITLLITKPIQSSDRLNSGDILKVGTSIISQNGQYRLTLQDDGNLVLYNLANSPLWASNTMNNNIAQIVMQTDGNMVMMDKGNQQIWSTGTSGNPGAYLVVQNDGSAVIYNMAGGKLWSTGQIQPPTTGLSAHRTIDKTTLIAGSDAIVTIAIQNDNTARAISLKESIPQGWSLSRISDDADQFKAVTNEWIWLSAASNAVKTAKYKLTVPPGTKAGTYSTNGVITTSGSTVDIIGDNTISVVTGDMLSYYRGLGVDANKVETSDLLKAADDWRNNIIPQGFSVPIATGQLLTLADEWRNS